MYENLIILAVKASITRLYAVELFFFFKTLEGFAVFKTIDIISPNINAGPSNGNTNTNYQSIILASIAYTEWSGYEV
jgi:hypothetical protein